MSIVTDRLELIPATVDLLHAARAGDAALASALDVRIPASWPPEFYGEQSIAYTLAQLERGSEQDGWLLHWFVVREGRTVIGYGGYKGAPADGKVEIGYAVVDDQQRLGYATEATLGLLTRAFTHPGIDKVVAETMPDRVASIRVLEKLGFRLVGPAEEEGAIRYELPRERFALTVLTSR